MRLLFPTLLLTSLITSLLSSQAVAEEVIFKCSQDDTVIFSEITCPKEFIQRELEFKHGLKIETQREPQPVEEVKVDKLTQLLNTPDLSEEKIQLLVKAEIRRLTQENSYLNLVKANEVKKLERRRYWDKTSQNDPQFLSEKQSIEQHFDSLTDLNNIDIELLKQHQHAQGY